MAFALQILNDPQKAVLGKLGFLKRYACYLGGGTAVALHLNHRTSLDFDFYCPNKFDRSKLLDEFKKNFSEVEEIGEQSDVTLQLFIEGVNVSVFYYPYTLISPLMELPPIEMNSLEDLAAMKIAAVIQRARQRDFFDLYYLINSIGIDKVVKSAFAKYPWYEDNNRVVFTGLTYFDEADLDDEINRVTIFDKNVTWEKVKTEISRQVQNYVKNLED